MACSVNGGVRGTFSIRKPATGIGEMRVFASMAYLEDEPGTAKPWLSFDLSSDQTEVPTQAAADALNLVGEVIAGECQWDERLAAIDPSGTVRVTAEKADGWTFSVPTDPESLRDKSSDSARPYEPGTWVVGKDGLPVSYRAKGSARVLAYSQWSQEKITAPPADTIHQ